MFAVIKTGGKQYRVAANDVIQVEKVIGEAGDVVEFGQVLTVGVGAGIAIGAPFVEGALVTAEILEQFRGDKTLSFKKRRRQNSKRIRGHRQMLTRLRIAEILTDGAKPSKAAKAKPVAAAEAAADAEPKKAAKPAKTEEKAAAQVSAKSDKSAAPAPAAPPATVADDVALIGGVGPALKKKLEGAGITTLSQIAAMSAEQMAAVDADLKLGGRTEREEWVEQAKELLAGKPPRAKVDRKAKEAE